MRILGEAWGKQHQDTTQDKSASTGQTTNLDPNVWDGTKEGNATNAQAFARMLTNTK